MRMPLLGCALLLSGCGTVAFKPVCPTLYEYPPEAQERAADELDRLGPGSQLEALMSDYGAVRAEIRECRDAA